MTSVEPAGQSKAPKAKVPSAADKDDLSPLSPWIIENQATINIGTLGHVSHGKSTIVESLSGIKPLKHHQEIERNITIKLGYANFKVWRCPVCPKPECYQSSQSSVPTTKKKPNKPERCAHCDEDMQLVRHFSFVDCPGHDCLMATMLNGAAVMDAALLVIASNQPVPQPQTAEHLAAAEIMKLKNIFICQTKLDLIDQNQAMENHKQIVKFVHETVAEKSPVVPIACTVKMKANIDVLLQYLVEKVPVPQRDFESPALLQVVRSFDINRPGDELAKLKGGVAGGTLKKGVLKIGDLIEIRPGLITKEPDGSSRCFPLFTRVISLFSEQNSLAMAVPGGLIGVGTTLDPVLCKADRLVGQVIGARGKLPPVYQELEISVSLMKRLIGATSDKPEGNAKPQRIGKLLRGESIMTNIASNSVAAKVIAVKDDGKTAKIFLSKPCCVEIGEQVSLSRNLNQSFRLIGCGQIIHGVPMPLYS